MDLDEVLVKLEYGLDNISVVRKLNLCNWCAVMDCSGVGTGRAQMRN
jgi:hypothetical protein